MQLVKKEVEDWIYARNFMVKRDLDNSYAKLKRDKRGSIQLGVPEGYIVHWYHIWD